MDTGNLPLSYLLPDEKADEKNNGQTDARLNDDPHFPYPPKKLPHYIHQFQVPQATKLKHFW